MTLVETLSGGWINPLEIAAIEHGPTRGSNGIPATSEYVAILKNGQHVVLYHYNKNDVDPAVKFFDWLHNLKDIGSHQE